MHRSRQIAAICWMDAKPVFLLSTACNPIDRHALGLDIHSRSHWHYAVAEDLMKPRMRGPIRNLVRGGLHYSLGHPTKRQRCVVCRSRTRRMCPGCGSVFQCEGACYRAVHTQLGYEANVQRVLM